MKTTQENKVLENRRGLSTVFSSLYMGIILLILIMTLFTAMQTSKTSLSTSMLTEEEKAQERISILGPDALVYTNSSIVLRVNNTGSITVRIRAIYINSTLICDPSTFHNAFNNDSYINPKEAIWIRLYPNPAVTWIELNETRAKMDHWTVATERGATVREIGKYLVERKPVSPYISNRFYIGPLMLVYDSFRWNDGTKINGKLVWYPGWQIPSGTSNVVWRILLVNIDKQDITINDYSCLTLIDNNPKSTSSYLYWYIDPENKQTCETTLEPNKYVYIYFKWTNPYSENHQAQAMPGGSEITYTTYLTFHGRYSDGKSLGETVPFEAVFAS